MLRDSLRRALPRTLLLGLASFGLASPPGADEPAAEDLVAAVEAARDALPQFDGARRQEEAYLEEYKAKLRPALEHYADLILELYRREPGHAALVEWMPERWEILATALDRTGPVLEETRVVMQSAGSPLADAARFWRANIRLHELDGEGRHAHPFDAARADVALFLEHGDPQRSAHLLRSLADRIGSPEELAAVQRLADEHPQASQSVRGTLRRMARVGEPFELAFEDAVTGEPVSMEGLRGKVVVIDFWATWCGPCVAEMPRMKELYAEYHDRGVEFIGVSLDLKEGGLEKLRSFVEQREIPWPQYYQGDGWQSAFSQSWGIDSIPALFVVDQKGRLHSTEARGKLETMLPALLASEGSALR